MFTKRLFAFITVIILLFTFVSCSDNYDSAIIYFGVNEPPKNIDPQCAKTVTELMLVKNLYEGLMRIDQDGNIVNGVAESYQKNGDTYTFKINENSVWNDGTPITAYDFEFGIIRALSPETSSPNADCLYAIKNAKQVHNGFLSVDLLGIDVIDKYTLKIVAEPNADILYALTTAPAMPCNEQFFLNSIGKYGMSFDTVLCNGSYKMRKWALEDFAMRIIKNDKYNGSFVAKNAAVYFSKSKDYTNLECLEKNYVDLAEIPTTDYNKAKEKNYTVTVLNNKVLIIEIGKSYTTQMRNALFESLINENDFKSYNDSYIFADTLFPNFFGCQNGKINMYNPQSAKTIYNAEIKKVTNKVFPSDTIYYYGDRDIANIVKSIAGHWQQNLGIYINIAPTQSNGEAEANAKNGYGIGVYSVEINQKNVEKYLQNFGVSSFNGNFDSVQKQVFDVSYAVPVSFYGSCFAHSDKLTNLKIESIGGSIDFSQVIKKK